MLGGASLTLWSSFLFKQAVDAGVGAVMVATLRCRRLTRRRSDRSESGDSQTVRTERGGRKSFEEKSNHAGHDVTIMVGILRKDLKFAG